MVEGELKLRRRGFLPLVGGAFGLGSAALGFGGFLALRGGGRRRWDLRADSQEGRGVAFVALAGAQARGFFGRLFRFGAWQGGGLRFDDGERIARLFAGAAVVAVTETVSVPLFARAIIPGTIVAWAVVTRAIVPRTVISWSIIPRPVVAGPVITWAVVSGTVVAIAVVVVVAGPITTAAVVAVALIAVVVVVAILPLAAILLATAFALVLGLALRLSLGLFHLGIGLGAALVFEVDVVARGEGVSADDVGDGAVRLGCADQAEIVFGVLQIVLGQNPVAATGRIPRQLLIFVKDMLGVAAHLDPLGTIGIERAVGIVLLGLVAAAPATAAIATALPFHTLEVSHMRPWSWALRMRAGLWFSGFF